MIRNLISVIFLIGAGAIFFLYTQPEYDTVQVLAAQGAQYDAALAKASELQQVKQSLLAKYNSFDAASLARLQTMIPDQVDNIRLILDMDNIANQHGMALQNVSISTPTSASAQTGAVGAISTGGTKYDSITMSFSTTGTYEQFKSFLADLEHSLRVVDIVSLSFSSSQTGSQSGQRAAGSEPTYSYSMTIRTYWLR